MKKLTAALFAAALMALPAAGAECSLTGRLTSILLAHGDPEVFFLERPTGRLKLVCPPALVAECEAAVGSQAKIEADPAGAGEEVVFHVREIAAPPAPAKAKAVAEPAAWLVLTIRPEMLQDALQTMADNGFEPRFVTALSDGSLLASGVRWP